MYVPNVPTTVHTVPNTVAHILYLLVQYVLRTATRTNCNTDVRIYVCMYIYKDRAAPPIGGPALHDSSVKTVQWREREGHDSYQEVEIYMCM